MTTLTKWQRGWHHGVSVNSPQVSRRNFLGTASMAAASGIFYPSRLSAADQKRDIFTDVTGAAGISWKHFNGVSPDRLLIEAMGGGVGFSDLTGSGSLDIFLLNGGETPGGKSSNVLRNALYRNLGNGRFEDVAGDARVEKLTNYGMGVAIGDFDNDGRQDIFLTGFPACT